MQANTIRRLGAIARNAATVVLLGLAAAVAAAVESDHAVGTLQRVDSPSQRLTLAIDAQTGSELGQGSPINLYFGSATTATRAGKPVAVTDLKPGERLLVRTRKSGNRVQAEQVLVLPNTDLDHGPRRYLHGTVHEIRTGTRMLHVDQADTLILNRIGYDANTVFVSLDGKPLDRTTLKPGDEVDMSLRLGGRITTAVKVVLLRRAGGK